MSPGRGKGPSEKNPSICSNRDQSLENLTLSCHLKVSSWIGFPCFLGNKRPGRSSVENLAPGDVQEEARLV